MPKLFTITAVEVDGQYPNPCPLYSVALTAEQIRGLRTIDYNYAMSSIRGDESPLIGPHGFSGAINDMYAKLQARFPTLNSGLGYKLCGQGETLGDMRTLLHQNKGLFRRLLGVLRAALLVPEPQVQAMELEDRRERDAEQSRQVIARQQEPARQAELARQAEIVRQQTEAARQALIRDQQIAAAKQAEISRQQAEAARLAEIARQQWLKQYCNMSPQAAADLLNQMDPGIAAAQFYFDSVSGVNVIGSPHQALAILKCMPLEKILAMMDMRTGRSIHAQTLTPIFSLDIAWATYIMEHLTAAESMYIFNPSYSKMPSATVADILNRISPSKASELLHPGSWGGWVEDPIKLEIFNQMNIEKLEAVLSQPYMANSYSYCLRNMNPIKIARLPSLRAEFARQDASRRQNMSDQHAWEASTITKTEITERAGIACQFGFNKLSNAESFVRSHIEQQVNVSQSEIAHRFEIQSQAQVAHQQLETMQQSEFARQTEVVRQQELARQAMSGNALRLVPVLPSHAFVSQQVPIPNEERITAMSSYVVYNPHATSPRAYLPQVQRTAGDAKSIDALLGELAALNRT